MLLLSLQDDASVSFLLFFFKRLGNQLMPSHCMFHFKMITSPAQKLCSNHIKINQASHKTRGWICLAIELNMKSLGTISVWHLIRVHSQKQKLAVALRIGANYSYYIYESAKWDWRVPAIKWRQNIIMNSKHDFVKNEDWFMIKK